MVQDTYYLETSSIVIEINPCSVKVLRSLAKASKKGRMNILIVNTICQDCSRILPNGFNRVSLVFCPMNTW